MVAQRETMIYMLMSSVY